MEIEMLEGFYSEIGFEVYSVLFIDVDNKRYYREEKNDVSEIMDFFPIVSEQIMEVILEGLKLKQYKEEKF